ncbi:MAG: single-stranded DNA-binding protein [Deltaproteobacteria bacterium]|jgi:single-strand DNA-binding protein|nr:single-stranded DNA-binding protein [Deltaproteobacteria bacterium]
MSLNKVLLQGNLGADPELKYTSTQLAVTNLSVATNERTKDANGVWIEKTEWHRITVFGKAAENCSQYLKKGRPVFIEGKLQNRKWQDKEGKDRYTIDIIASSVQFMGGGAQTSNGTSYNNNYNNNIAASESIFESSAPQLEENAVSFNDDDIPF